MANIFTKLVDMILGPNDDTSIPLTPQELADVEYFMFEIFAQQKATAWKPVGAVLFSPRLRQSSPHAPHMSDGMTSLLAKGWVETKNVRFLVLTDAGYARMQELGIKPAKD